MTALEDQRDRLKSRTEELLSEAERLKAELDAIPGWHPVRRWRADKAWLRAVGALQENERQLAQLR